MTKEQGLLAEAFSTVAKTNLELYQTKIMIRRKGYSFFEGFRGDKEILLRSITSIRFKTPGAVSYGFIQFSIMGGQESRAGLMGSIYQAGQDENAIVIGKHDFGAFETIKEAIEKRVALSQDVRTDKGHSDIDDIERLAILRNKGVLTEEEFQAKKKQLLRL